MRFVDRLSVQIRLGTSCGLMFLVVAGTGGVAMHRIERVQSASEVVSVGLTRAHGTLASLVVRAGQRRTARTAAIFAAEQGSAVLPPAADSLVAGIDRPAPEAALRLQDLPRAERLPLVQDALRNSMKNRAGQAACAVSGAADALSSESRMPEQTIGQFPCNVHAA